MTSSMPRTLSVLFMAGSLVWGACGEDKILLPSYGSREFRLASFPQVPESRWTYALSDTSWGGSLGPIRACTLQVTVGEADTLPDLGAVSPWFLDCQGETDTLYLSAAGDTLTFYSMPGDVPWPNRELTFPLSFPLYVGRTWSTPGAAAWVDTQVVVCTPAGGFNALVILEDHSQPNAPHVQRVDFVPGVGIVRKQEYYFFTLGRTGFLRELVLLEYHPGAAS